MYAIVTTAAAVSSQEVSIPKIFIRLLHDGRITLQDPFLDAYYC